MIQIILKRILQGVPTVFGVTLITFLLFNVAGGDPVSLYLGKSANPKEIELMKKEYGLDQPLVSQYTDFLEEIVTFDFGKSFRTRDPVSDMLIDRIGPSLSLTIPSLILITMIGVGLALISTYYRGQLFDRMLIFTAVTGMSISFLVYIVVGQYFLAFELGLFEIYGYRDTDDSRWSYLALPILIMTTVGVGYDSRYYRAVMLEERQAAYILTAHAKGLSDHRIMLRHILSNALIPIISRVMISVPFLVTGSLLLESFFGIPGTGSLLLESLMSGDLPVIKAFTVLVSILFVLSNIITDLLYIWADPRVRMQ